MTMNENTLEGTLTQGAGKVESFAGEALDDREVRARGEGRQIKGQAQEAVGATQAALGKVAEQAKVAAGALADQAKETYGRVSDQAKDAYGRVSDQAKDAYGKVAGQAKDVYGRVDPLVREKPYAALAIAGAAGFVLGLLMSGGGSKVIYLKSRD